jgi:isoleucyl-tRNA synthetase
MADLKKDGFLAFTFGADEVKLTEEDLLIDAGASDRYVSEGDNAVTVVLDTQLTDALIEEGFVREVISKVQTMRKEAGFEVMDRIVLSETGNQKIEEIMRKNEAEIRSEVLASEVKYGALEGYEKDWNLNGEDVKLGVQKIDIH